MCKPVYDDDRRPTNFKQVLSPDPLPLATFDEKKVSFVKFSLHCSMLTVANIFCCCHVLFFDGCQNQLQIRVFTVHVHFVQGKPPR